MSRDNSVQSDPKAWMVWFDFPDKCPFYVDGYEKKRGYGQGSENMQSWGEAKKHNFERVQCHPVIYPTQRVLLAFRRTNFYITGTMDIF